MSEVQTLSAEQARPRPGLSMVEVWVIQHDTPEAPGKYTVRRHWLFHGTNFRPKSHAQEAKLVVADGLEEARRWVPEGLFRLKPDPQENAVTVEMWL